MNKLIGSVCALAMLAPVSAFAMPVVGATAPAPAATAGAKLERVVVIVKTGPRVVRPRARVVVRPRAVVRPGPRVIVR